MRKSDTQIGKPYQEYTGTKAAIEALTGLTEGCIAYATDSNELGSYTGAAWVWLPTLPISSNNVSMPKVGTPTLDTLTEDFTTRGSAGVADGTLTYLTVGTSAVKVSVAAGEGYIRTSADQQAPLVFCAWAASPDLYTFSAPAAGQETAIFFGISYNAGTPIAISSSTFSDFNGYDKIILGRVSYDGTNMEILNAYHHAEDTAKLTRQYLREVFPFIRESPPEGTGGLELATSGTNQMSMTAGHIHHGFNEYIINAIAAGAAFDTHYRRAGGGFVSASGVTAWEATKYDDASGTLATMTNNRYGTRWIYLDVGKNSVVATAYNAQLDMVYGTSNATSVANAQAELAPSIPAHLTYHGRLIGRIIFQKSATSSTLVESAWSTLFAASAVGDHSLLTNLQGGAASEYYHLTSADNTETAAWANGGTGTHTATDSHIASTSNPHSVTAAQVAAIPNDGWVADTFTRTGTHTFTVASATNYQKGVKVRYKDGGANYEYGVVESVSGTTITLITNTSYSSASAMTNGGYSLVENPVGWNDTFNYTTVISTTAGAITSYTVQQASYKVWGNTIKVDVNFTITDNGSGAGGVKFTTPVLPTLQVIGAGRENAVQGWMVQVTWTASSGFATMYTYNNAYPGGKDYVLFGSVIAQF